MCSGSRGRRYQIFILWTVWSGESSGELENLERGGENIDYQTFHSLIINPIIKLFIPWLSIPLIIRLFPYPDYHESVIPQKNRLKDLILIIKSTYQGWYVSSSIVTLSHGESWVTSMISVCRGNGLSSPRVNVRPHSPCPSWISISPCPFSPRVQKKKNFGARRAKRWQ